MAAQPFTGRPKNRRIRECAERQRTGEADEEELATDERIVLSPLPCWKHLSEEEYGRRVADLAEAAVEAAACERRRTGKKVLGVKKILKTDPLSYPESVEKSPKPRFQAYVESTGGRAWGNSILENRRSRKR